MNKIIISIFLSTFLILVSCSGNIRTIDRDYQITNKLHMTSAVEDKSLKLQIENSNGNKINFDTIEVPNDIPKLEFAFSQNIKGRQYVLVGISYNEDYRDEDHSYINYSKYYSTLAYKCNSKYRCVFDEKISPFFGSGGDLLNNNTNEKLNIYLYKTEEDVKKALDSDFFNNWLNNTPTNGHIIKKTILNDIPSYTDTDADIYLIAGLNFIVTEVSSGWLKINYIKNNHKIDGWIKCRDTNLCS